MLTFLKRIKRKYFPSDNQKPIYKRENFLKFRSNIKIGNSLLFNNFYLDITKQTERVCLSIGNDCMIGGTFSFQADSGQVTIGDRVYFAGGNVICNNKVEIEDDVFISWGVYLFDNDSHSLDYKNRLIDMQNHLIDWRSGLSNYNVSKDWTTVNSKPIKICKFVWIGMDCKILKGVTIGEGAIVGSGSVVTKDVEPWTVVGGNPAKIIKILSPELRK